MIRFFMAFSVACALSVRCFSLELRLLMRLGNLMAWLNLFAGIMDALENFVLVQLLQNPNLNSWLVLVS